MDRAVGSTALLLCALLTVCASRAMDRQELRQTLEAAKTGGCVVTEDLHVTAGREVWQAFYKTVQAGEPAEVRLVNRYSQDERSPERLYESSLCFDGEYYTISGESGGPDGGPWGAAYQYLLYFPDVPSPSPSSTYESASWYILADDDTLTWEKIWNSWFSSSSEGRIRTHGVYTEYVWREDLFNDDLM